MAKKLSPSPSAAGHPSAIVAADRARRPCPEPANPLPPESDLPWKTILLQAAFERDGFVVIEDFLSPSKSANCSPISKLHPRPRAQAPGTHAFYQDKTKPETLKQMQFMEKVDPYFQEYTRHPSGAGGRNPSREPIMSVSPSWFNKPPLTDHPTRPPGQLLRAVRPLQLRDDLVALDPVDDENGCLSYLPGSHRIGFRPIP